ncbi:MAG: hypothetical protein R2844_20880 [Caldilineales bacterium]
MPNWASQPSPDPVPDQRVDEQADDEAVDEVSAEAGALGHQTGGDGRSGGREAELKEEEGKSGDAGDFSRYAPQEKPFLAEERVADAEHDGEPGDEVADRGHGGVQQVLGHDVDDVLGANEARLESQQPCMKKTRKAASSTQPVLMAAMRSVTVGGSSPCALAMVVVSRSRSSSNTGMLRRRVALNMRVSSRVDHDSPAPIASVAAMITARPRHF